MQGMLPYMEPKKGGGTIGIIIFVIVSLIIGGGIYLYINFSNCKNFKCPDGSGIVDDAENVEGHDEEKCCQPIKCYGNVDITNDYKCETGTILKGDASNIISISQNTCCEDDKVSISIKFSQSWNDLSEEAKTNFIDNYKIFISRKLDILESEVIIQDGYPREGSTIIVSKIVNEDLTKDIINQKLTGISGNIGGLTIEKYSIKDTNYEAVSEVTRRLSSSSSGCSDTRYQGQNCTKCNEDHYVKENTDGTYSCEVCPRGTGWDWSKSLTDGSDITNRVDTELIDCFSFITDCPSNYHVEGIQGICTPCGDTYFGLTTDPSEPEKTHNPELRGPDQVTNDEGTGSKCRFLKNGWGGPPENDNTLKKEILDTSYGAIPSQPPPFTKYDLTNTEGFTNDIYNTIPSESRNKIDQLFIRQCSPETHSASYTLSDGIFKNNNEGTEEVIDQNNNIFTSQKDNEYNCYRKNICSSFRRKLPSETETDAFVKRTGTIESIFKDLDTEDIDTLNSLIYNDNDNGNTCTRVPSFSDYNQNLQAWENGEPIATCSCLNSDGLPCTEEENDCKHFDTSSVYRNPEPKDCKFERLTTADSILGKPPSYELGMVCPSFCALNDGWYGRAATCTGDNRGNARTAQCLGDVDGRQRPCELNSAGDGCRDESGDCYFVPEIQGDPCILNSDNTACAPFTDEGNCVYTPPTGTCKGTNDGSGGFCRLNDAGDGCVVQGGDCVYTPYSGMMCIGDDDGTGTPCTLNDDGTRCAVEGGNCEYIYESHCIWSPPENPPSCNKAIIDPEEDYCIPKYPIKLYRDPISEDCTNADFGSCPSFCFENGSGPTCTGNDDGTGNPCTLNDDGTRCAVEGGDCVYTQPIGTCEAPPEISHIDHVVNLCQRSQTETQCNEALNDFNEFSPYPDTNCIYTPYMGCSLNNHRISDEYQIYPKCQDLVNGGNNCVLRENSDLIDEIDFSGECRNIQTSDEFYPKDVGFGFIYSNEKDCHESKLCGTNNNEQCMWFPGSKVNTFINHAGMLYENDPSVRDLMRCDENGDCSDIINGEEFLEDTNNIIDECEIKNKIAIYNYNNDVNNVLNTNESNNSPGSIFYKSEKCRLKGENTVDNTVDNICVSVYPSNTIIDCESLNAIECESYKDQNDKNYCKLEGVCQSSDGEEYKDYLNKNDCILERTNQIISKCNYIWESNRICDENECEFFHDDDTNSINLENLEIIKNKDVLHTALPEKNAIMGYEYRKKIEDITFKNRERDFNGDEIFKYPREIHSLDLNKDIEGNNIDLVSTLNNEWNCDINNDIIFPEDGCGDGFYSKEEDYFTDSDNLNTILDKKIIKNGPNVNGNTLIIKGNTTCDICDPWTGDDSDDKLNRYNFPKSSPYFYRNNLVKCLKCNNQGRCIQPECMAGYFFNKRTRTCETCTEIPNRDDNIVDYTSLFENNSPTICTNRNDTKFNKLKVLPKSKDNSYDIKFYCKDGNGNKTDPSSDGSTGNLTCGQGSVLVKYDERIEDDSLELITGFCDINSDLQKINDRITFFGRDGGNVLLQMNIDENNRQRAYENSYIFNNLNNKYYRDDYFRYTINGEESNITCTGNNCSSNNFNDQTKEKIFFIDITNDDYNSLDDCAHGANLFNSYINNTSSVWHNNYVYNGIGHWDFRREERVGTTHNRPETFAQCTNRCDQDPNCKGFSYRENDSNCITFTGSKHIQIGDTETLNENFTRKFITDTSGHSAYQHPLNFDEDYINEYTSFFKKNINQIIGFNYDENNSKCELIVKNNSEFSPNMDGDTEKEDFNILNLEQYTSTDEYSTTDTSNPDLKTYLIYDDYPDYPKIQCNFKSKNECELFNTGLRRGERREFCKWKSLEELINKDCITNYKTPPADDETYVEELNNIIESEICISDQDKTKLSDVYNIAKIDSNNYYEKQQTCNLNLLRKLQEINSDVNTYSNHNSIFKSITSSDSYEIIQDKYLNDKNIVKPINNSKQFKCGFPCKPGYYLNKDGNKDQCLPCSKNSIGNFSGISCVDDPENCNMSCSTNLEGEMENKSFMCNPGFLYKDGSCISCIGSRAGTEASHGIYSNVDDTTNRKYYSCSIPPESEDSISPDIKITSCIGSNDDDTEGNKYTKVHGFCTKVTELNDSGIAMIEEGTDFGQLGKIINNHKIFTSEDYENADNLFQEPNRESYEECGSCIKQTINIKDEARTKIIETVEYESNGDLTTKETCENKNNPKNPNEVFYWKVFTLDNINNSNDELYEELSEKYIWTSDKCIPCKGVWTTENNKLIFTNCCTVDGCSGCPSEAVKCPYQQNEKPSYVAELPELYSEEDTPFNKLKNLNKNRHKRMPLKNTLHGVAIASSYSNKGYEPKFEPHNMDNNGKTEYYKRNNSWGVVNNDRVEDPAICERTIPLEKREKSDDYRENYNSAIWPMSWLGDSRGEDFDTWDMHFISLGEWNMNKDNEVNGVNYPFFTSPDNTGWLSAQMKSRNPVSTGPEVTPTTSFFSRLSNNKNACRRDPGIMGVTYQPVEPEHGAHASNDLVSVWTNDDSIPRWEIWNTGVEPKETGACAVVDVETEKQASEFPGNPAYQLNHNKKVPLPMFLTGTINNPTEGKWVPKSSREPSDEPLPPKYYGYLNSKYPYKHNSNLYGDKLLKWGRMKEQETSQSTWTQDRLSQNPSKDMWLRPRYYHTHCKNWNDENDPLNKYICPTETEAQAAAASWTAIAGSQWNRPAVRSLGDRNANNIPGLTAPARDFVPVTGAPRDAMVQQHVKQGGGDASRGPSGSTPNEEDRYGYHTQMTGDQCFNYSGGNDASWSIHNDIYKRRNLCKGKSITMNQLPIMEEDTREYPVERREEPVEVMNIRDEYGGMGHGPYFYEGSSNNYSSCIDAVNQEDCTSPSTYKRYEEVEYQSLGTKPNQQLSNRATNYGEKNRGHITEPEHNVLIDQNPDDLSPHRLSFNAGINVAARQWAYISDAELSNISDEINDVINDEIEPHETLNTYGRNINYGIEADVSVKGYHSKPWEDVYKPIRPYTYPFNDGGIPHSVTRNVDRKSADTKKGYDMEYFNPDISYGWSGINIDLNNVHGTNGNQMGRYLTYLGKDITISTVNDPNGEGTITRARGSDSINYRMLSEYMTGRGLGGGGRMGGDFEYAASTLDAKRVENGVPGVCFVNTTITGAKSASEDDFDSDGISGGRSGKDIVYFDTESSDNNYLDTRVVRGGQVWTGRTYWGTKENEEDWLTSNDDSFNNNYKDAILPKHDGYKLPGTNKNRPRTGYMFIDLGVNKVPHPTTSQVSPLESTQSDCGNGYAACNTLEETRKQLEEVDDAIPEFMMSAGITPDQFSNDEGYPDNYEYTTDQCFFILDQSDIEAAADQEQEKLGVDSPVTFPDGTRGNNNRYKIARARDSLGGSYTPYHIGKHHNVDNSIAMSEEMNLWNHTNHPFEFNPSTDDVDAVSGILNTSLISEKYDSSINGRNKGDKIFSEANGFSNIDSKFDEIKELNRDGRKITCSSDLSSGGVDCEMDPDVANENYQMYRSSGYPSPAGTTFDSTGELENWLEGRDWIQKNPLLEDPMTGQSPYHRMDPLHVGMCNRVEDGKWFEVEPVSATGSHVAANNRGAVEAYRYNNSIPKTTDLYSPEICKTNLNYGLDANLYDFSNNSSNLFSNTSSLDKLVSESNDDKSSTGESWTHKNVSRILVDADPIYKGVGSKTGGKETSITDKEFKTCADYCKANKHCTSFTYRDYFTNIDIEGTTGHASPLNMMLKDKAVNAAGLCCLKTKTNNAKIIADSPTATTNINTIDDPGRNQGYYEPYETFIQCPKDPVYSELEEKIMGTSKLTKTGIERVNQMNDIYLSKKAGYENGEHTNTSESSKKHLIRSKSMIGQMIAAKENQNNEYPLTIAELNLNKRDENEIDEILTDLSNQNKYNLRKNFSKKYLFNNTEDPLYGAGKEAVQCLKKAEEINQTIEEDTLEYNSKYAYRNHFLGGPLGIKTYEKINQHSNINRSDTEALPIPYEDTPIIRDGIQLTQSASTALKYLGKIPRSGQHVSNVWDTDLYPKATGDRTLSTWADAVGETTTDTTTTR